jgi:hypothetical protein
MSYYQPHPAKNRTTVWVVLAVVLIPLVLVGAYFLGRGSRGANASSARATSAVPSAPVISWSIIGDEPVPSSPNHGPRSAEGGLAKGFSHDTLGAALAAMNIGTRLASEVGPQVYEPTVREQCFGNIDSEIEQIRDSYSTAPPGAAKYSEVWYRVASGDPASDLVLMSIVVKTPQSVERGGYVRLDNTMQWINGDWKMQVPIARPLVIPSVEGYTLLGRPNV